jgi:hypothetical protein
MTTADLIETLARQGVELWLEGDRACAIAPHAMSPLPIWWRASRNPGMI